MYRLHNKFTGPKYLVTDLVVNTVASFIAFRGEEFVLGGHEEEMIAAIKFYSTKINFPRLESISRDHYKLWPIERLRNVEPIACFENYLDDENIGISRNLLNSSSSNSNSSNSSSSCTHSSSASSSNSRSSNSRSSCAHSSSTHSSSAHSSSTHSRRSRRSKRSKRSKRSIDSSLSALDSFMQELEKQISEQQAIYNNQQTQVMTVSDQVHKSCVSQTQRLSIIQNEEVYRELKLISEIKALLKSSTDPFMSEHIPSFASWDSADDNLIEIKKYFEDGKFALNNHPLRREHIFNTVNSYVDTFEHFLIFSIDGFPCMAGDKSSMEYPGALQYELFDNVTENVTLFVDGKIVMYIDIPDHYVNIHTRKARAAKQAAEDAAKETAKHAAKQAAKQAAKSGNIALNDHFAFLKRRGKREEKREDMIDELLFTLENYHPETDHRSILVRNYNKLGHFNVEQKEVEEPEEKSNLLLEIEAYIAAYPETRESLETANTDIFSEHLPNHLRLMLMKDKFPNEVGPLEHKDGIDAFMKEIPIQVAQRPSDKYSYVVDGELFVYDADHPVDALAQLKNQLDLAATNFAMFTRYTIFVNIWIKHERSYSKIRALHSTYKQIRDRALIDLPTYRDRFYKRRQIFQRRKQQQAAKLEKQRQIYADLVARSRRYSQPYDFDYVPDFLNPDMDQKTRYAKAAKYYSKGPKLDLSEEEKANLVFTENYPLLRCAQNVIGIIHDKSFKLIPKRKLKSFLRKIKRAHALESDREDQLSNDYSGSSEYLSTDSEEYKEEQNANVFQDDYCPTSDDEMCSFPSKSNTRKEPLGYNCMCFIDGKICSATTIMELHESMLGKNYNAADICYKKQYKFTKFIEHSKCDYWGIDYDTDDIRIGESDISSWSESEWKSESSSGEQDFNIFSDSEIDAEAEFEAIIDKEIKLKKRLEREAEQMDSDEGRFESDSESVDLKEHVFHVRDHKYSKYVEFEKPRDVDNYDPKALFDKLDDVKNDDTNVNVFGRAISQNPSGAQITAAKPTFNKDDYDSDYDPEFKEEEKAAPAPKVDLENYDISEYFRLEVVMDIFPDEKFEESGDIIDLVVLKARRDLSSGYREGDISQQKEEDSDSDSSVAETDLNETATEQKNESGSNVFGISSSGFGSGFGTGFGSAVDNSALMAIAGAGLGDSTTLAEFDGNNLSPFAFTNSTGFFTPAPVGPKLTKREKYIAKLEKKAKAASERVQRFRKNEAKRNEWLEQQRLLDEQNTLDQPGSLIDEQNTLDQPGSLNDETKTETEISPFALIASKFGDKQHVFDPDYESDQDDPYDSEHKVMYILPKEYMNPMNGAQLIAYNDQPANVPHKIQIDHLPIETETVPDVNKCNCTPEIFDEHNSKYENCRRMQFYDKKHCKHENAIRVATNRQYVELAGYVNTTLDDWEMEDFEIWTETELCLNRNMDAVYAISNMFGKLWKELTKEDDSSTESKNSSEQDQTEDDSSTESKNSSEDDSSNESKNSSDDDSSNESENSSDDEVHIEYVVDPNLPSYPDFAFLLTGPLDKERKDIIFDLLNNLTKSYETDIGRFCACLLLHQVFIYLENPNEYFKALYHLQNQFTPIQIAYLLSIYSRKTVFHVRERDTQIVVENGTVTDIIYGSSTDDTKPLTDKMVAAMNGFEELSIQKFEFDTTRIVDVSGKYHEEQLMRYMVHKPNYGHSCVNVCYDDFAEAPIVTEKQYKDEQFHALMDGCREHVNEALVAVTNTIFDFLGREVEHKLFAESLNALNSVAILPRKNKKVYVDHNSIANAHSVTVPDYGFAYKEFDVLEKLPQLSLNSEHGPLNAVYMEFLDNYIYYSEKIKKMVAALRATDEESEAKYRLNAFVHILKLQFAGVLRLRDHHKVDSFQLANILEKLMHDWDFYYPECKHATERYSGYWAKKIFTCAKMDINSTLDKIDARVKDAKVLLYRELRISEINEYEIQFSPIEQRPIVRAMVTKENYHQYVPCSWYHAYEIIVEQLSCAAVPCKTQFTQLISAKRIIVTSDHLSIDNCMLGRRDLYEVKESEMLVQIPEYNYLFYQDPESKFKIHGIKID